MKNKLIQLTIILFSLAFATRVITVSATDRLYSMSLAVEEGAISPNKAITYLDYAIRLDSTNADFYYQKYRVLSGLSPKGTVPDEERKVQKQQLHFLRHCINLCPPWPRYHLNYALTLSKMSPRANLMTRESILSELKKASDLKPYSPLYQRIYQARLNIYK